MALEDILSEDLTVEQVRILTQHIFETGTISSDYLGLGKDTTPKKSKSLIEFYGLVKNVIDNYETRAGTEDVNKVVFTEEEPDETLSSEVITFSVVERVPGAFSQGAPGEGKVKNLHPMIREEIDDPTNPGYRLAVYGYWHDNVVRFTCWARTNKQANARADWLEGMFEEYAWYFRAEGVSRVFFKERQADLVINVNGNKWYGRPLDYSVRTETIRAFSEKKIEQILLKVAVKTTL